MKGGSRLASRRPAVAGPGGDRRGGVAAACESVSPQERLGGASARGQSVSSDCASVSSAGAYAAAAACDAAAKILRFSRETFEDSVSSASGSGAVPEGTRLALLNVLARAHAASAKANAASVAAAGTAFASSASSESSSIESLLGGRDRLVSLETVAGGALVAALRREANRGDAGTETRAAAADRLGATCAATLEGIVAIAAPPPFPRPIGLSNTGANTGAVRPDANETDDATTETASDDAWLAAAAAGATPASRASRRRGGLDALVSLRETHASAFFRRGAAAARRRRRSSPSRVRGVRGGGALLRGARDGAVVESGGDGCLRRRGGRRRGRKHVVARSRSEGSGGNERRRSCGARAE